MFGPFPGDPGPPQGRPNGFPTDTAGGQTVGKRRGGEVVERPVTGWRATQARAALEQEDQLVNRSGGEGRMRPRMGHRRSGLKGRAAMGVKGMDGVANGLVATAQLRGNRDRRVALSAGQ